MDNVCRGHSACEVFEDLARSVARGLFNDPASPHTLQLQPFDLAEYLAAFNITAPANFLTDQALEPILTELEESMGRLRFLYLENERLTVAALPCTLHGGLLNSDHFNDSLNISGQVPPYLFILKSNPDDTRGLCEVSGVVPPLPLLKILPQQIITNCSFLVKYPAIDPNNPVDQPRKDFEYLKGEFSKIYYQLQALFK